MKTLTINYQFKFEDESERQFQVVVNAEDMLIANEPTEAPDWARLDFNKCPHCPYDSAKVPYCPVAKNLAHVAESFKQESSFRPTTVFVRTENRFYGKKTDMQNGLQSLFGLVMATSSCSHMSLFRSMALYHLPFSTFEETAIRSMGTYLIKEFLKLKRGRAGDFELKELIANYERVSVLNQHMMKRIRSITQGDADQNAIIILDNFASLLPMEIKSGLEQISTIFRSA